MRNFLLIILVLLFFSCSKETTEEKASFDDIKYFTINSQKPGALIKEKLKDKNILLLAYPEYAAESYSLIKYIAAIMNREGDLIITLPGHPETEIDEPLINRLQSKAPLLGFLEYIELNDYLKSLGLTITGTIKATDDKLLILAPAKDFIKIDKEVSSLFSRDKIIKVVLAGSKLTASKHNIIRELPTLKKISSTPLINNRFDILMLMGEIENYTQVIPVKLYSEENYLEAPKSFIEENRSLIKSVHVKRMNNYLPKLIFRSFKN